MTSIDRELTETDIPEFLANFLNGNLPLQHIKAIFADIEGNDIGDLDVILADGRKFRAYFEQVVED